MPLFVYDLSYKRFIRLCMFFLFLKFMLPNSQILVSLLQLLYDIADMSSSLVGQHLADSVPKSDF